MDLPDGQFLEPNNGAYEQPEIRHGLPLHYVSEKLASALESTHKAYQALKKRQAGDPSIGQEREQARRSTWAAFRYSTTAFLALHNMLGLIDDQGKFDALLKLSSKRFSAWLATVRREGSIGGYAISDS